MKSRKTSRFFIAFIKHLFYNNNALVKKTLLILIASCLEIAPARSGSLSGYLIMVLTKYKMLGGDE